MDCHNAGDGFQVAHSAACPAFLACLASLVVDWWACSEPFRAAYPEEVLVAYLDAS